MKPKLIIKYLGPLTQGQFYGVAQKKTSIGLHHTAGGSAAEAVRWWNQTKDVVGTALLVERDGAAYQCFEINQWAYSLGLSIPKNQKDLFEKSNIGIELVSRGWVLKEGDKFFAYPLWPLKTKKIEIEADEVTELKEAWRGYKYWHKYTDEQIETTVQLCRYLVDRFKIDVQDDLEGFWDYNLDFAKKNQSGIFSHTTVRKDKFDIYPEPKLIAALKVEFNKAKPKAQSKTESKPETKVECKEVPVSPTKK